MKICVINGSPKGNYSITIHTMLYLEKLYPDHTFEYLNIGQQIKYFEKDLFKAKTPAQCAGVRLSVLFCIS